MILSNVEILRCITQGLFFIDPIKGIDPTRPPFNTSAIDLHLATEITVPDASASASIDLRKGNIAQYWAKHSKTLNITDDMPYVLGPNKLILARTIEKVGFPLLNGAEICYSARVEGRSSLARCGILVHFTAPTIHAGFSGTITLEIINLGSHDFLLFPNLSVCQLIIEEVKGCPADAPNQFKGQVKPVGVA
jgi:dCTP deaminase